LNYDILVWFTGPGTVHYEVDIRGGYARGQAIEAGPGTPDVGIIRVRSRAGIRMDPQWVREIVTEAGVPSGHRCMYVVSYFVTGTFTTVGPYFDRRDALDHRTDLINAGTADNDDIAIIEVPTMEGYRTHVNWYQAIDVV